MSIFTVTNQQTGRTFEVLPDESILDAALRNGFSLPYSCRNGTCAACTAHLIKGRVTLDQYDKTALSDEQLESSQILLCRAHPTEDLVIDADEISVLENIFIQQLPCRVSSLEHLTHDVMKMTLALPRDTTFNYIAGQYVDIITRDGRRRGFSIANAPSAGDELELHLRHVPNGRFTTQVFHSMKVRDILRFEGPLGTFFLRNDSDAPVVLIGGGTGFAPLNAIIQDALSSSSSRHMHLFWGVRSAQDLYLQERIRRWTKDHGERFAYTPVLSEPRPDDVWDGATGWVHETVLEHYPDLSGLEVYASGPPPMIEAIRAGFPERGVDVDRLYYDSFEYSSDTLYPDSFAADN